jgi:hypothetical protein
MSSFEINCTVEGAAPDNLSHECGATKNLTWSGNGTHSGLSFYLIRTQLSDLKPSYVFKIPKVLKLLKFIFTPISPNIGSTKVKVRVKYNVDGVLRILDEYELGNISTQAIKYHQLLMDLDTKDNGFIMLDVITSDGTSGSINVELDCDPSLISAEFCRGFTSPTQHCSTCPQTVTYYREKLPDSPIAGLVNKNVTDYTPFLVGPWYIDPYLQTELNSNETLTLNVGELNKRTKYSYNSTTHKFENIGNCFGDGYGCGTGELTIPFYLSGYTESTPYLPGTPGVKPNGLKYAIKNVLASTATQNRIVPVTVTATDSAEDVSLLITDGLNGDQIGGVSYSYDSGNVGAYDAVTPFSLIKVRYKLGEGAFIKIGPRNFNTSKTFYVVTTSGLVNIRLAVGQNKSYNGGTTNVKVTIGCGSEIYGYDMGVNPYSPYDAYHNPKFVTKIWSKLPISQWSGSTNNYSTKGNYIWMDNLLTTPSLPYFYGDSVRTSPTNKVYQVGNLLNREFGITVNYVATRFIIGPTNTKEVIDGPRNHAMANFREFFTNPPADYTYDANRRYVPANVHPTMVGVGTLNKIINNSDLLQPSVYSYLLGWSGLTSNEYDVNNNTFTFFDFNNNKHLPATGFEHCVSYMTRGYVGGSYIPNIPQYMVDNKFKYWAGGGALAGNLLNFLINLDVFGPLAYNTISTYVGAGTYVGSGGLGSLAGGAATLTPLGVIAIYVLPALIFAALVYLIIPQQKLFIETPKYFRKRYSNKPFLNDSDSSIKLYDNLTGVISGYYSDGGYIYFVPSGSTTGFSTIRKLSYKYVDGVKTFTQIDILNDTTKQEYIIDAPRLFYLSYISGRPEKYDNSPTLYSSSAISLIGQSQSSTIVGELNNPIPIKYSLPVGHVVSTISQEDADNQAQGYLISLTGLTESNTISAERKPGVINIETYFTHELKLEMSPNYFSLWYDNSDSLGITVNKKLYYDNDGKLSALNGYYRDYKKNNLVFYKVQYGVVTDIFSGTNSLTSQLNGGTYYLNGDDFDYTSAWFIDSYNPSDLSLSFGNDFDGLITNWNTNLFYTGDTINKGIIKNRTNPDGFYIYDNNLTATTYSEANESSYREVYPFDSNVFTYYKPQTLLINIEEVSDLDNDDNGLNFNVVDTNGNASPTYVGITFTANIYTGSTVLFTTKSVTIGPNETNKFVQLDIPYTGGTITSVNIVSYDSPNPFNKTTFEQNAFAQSTGVTACDYYSGTTYIVDSYGFVQYDEYNISTGTINTIYSNVTEGIYTINQPIAYKSLKGSQDEVNYYPVANIRILETGDCYVLPTPTPTPTNTVTPTLTPTQTPTPTTVCEFGLSVIVLTPTPTPTTTVTPTNTVTPSVTPTNTVTPSLTPTQTPTPTTICEFGLSVIVLTQTPTPTPTNTVTPTITPSVTPTNTVTPTVTQTQTPTPTTVCEFGLSVIVLTPTPTPTPSATPNYPPTDISLSNSSINENTATGTTIGTFSSTSLDPGDTYTYTLVTGTGDDNNGSFTISGSSLKNGFIPNYESKTSYLIRVRSTDSIGQFTEKQFTININNVNETPTLLTLSNSSQAENTATGTTIGTFSTSDVDGGDTFTYSLVSGTGDTDNASFNISGANLRNASIFNYEVKNSYSIRVRTTDAGGLFYEGTFTISVTNVNEAPTDISLSSASISENVPTGTTIGTFSATDPEGGAMTFALHDTVNYPDNSSFTITSGVLKSAVVFNYEAKSSYSIRVRVTDSTSLTFDKTITISITDVTITPSLTITNATCNGGSNGSIVVSSVVGGTANYTYSKDGTNYQVSSTFSSLTAGNYTIYVKDTYGEVGSTNATVTQPTVVSVSATGTNPTCFGSTNGSILVNSASGGSGSGYSYSRDNVTYQTGTTFSSLTNGTYTIYAKDSNDCVGSTSVTLNRTQITATTTQTNVTCNGAAEGSIVVSSPSGGQGGPYSTKINAGGTYQVLTSSRTYSSLTAGTYTLYVKDSADCERTYSIVITEPTPFVITPDVVHPTCSYDSNGSITVNVSGGDTFLQLYYALSSNLGSTYTAFQASNVFSNLPAGSSYIVKIEQEITGCQKTQGPITLAKSAVTTTLTPSHLTCFGQNNDGVFVGSVSIAYPSGGNGAPYQIKLGSGGTYSTITAGTTTVWGNQRGGLKTVFIKDSQNCEFTFTTTVNEPTQVTASVSASSPNCSGSLGSITVTSLAGGSGTGYQVKLGSGGTYENFSTSKTYSSLAGGTYTIYVKDSLGCETAYTTGRTIPAPVTISLSSSSAPTCFDGNNGTIVGSASGGNGSYEYKINTYDYQPSGTFTGLGGSVYTLQARDSNGCESAIINVDITKSRPTANISTTNVSCRGGSNGSIAISNPSGGNGGTYEVSLSDEFNDWYTIPKTFSDLDARNYTVYIKDVNGCTSPNAITITQPESLTAVISNVIIPEYDNPTGGSLDMSSGGGVFPKTYRLYEDTTAPYTTCGGTLIATFTDVTSGDNLKSVTGLTSGGYCLEVTDANGCVVNSGVTVLTDGLPPGYCWTYTYTSVPSDLYVRYKNSAGNLLTTRIIDLESMDNGNGSYTAAICVYPVGNYSEPICVQNGSEVFCPDTWIQGDICDGSSAPCFLGGGF